MKNFLITLIITTFSLFIIACGEIPDASEAYKGESPREIFTKGKQALLDKNYTEASKRFEALDIQYPFDSETEKAQLYLIYIYFMKEDYALSVSSADHFIKMHPASSYLDYAYYMKGVANYYQNLGLFERFFVVDLATRDLTQIQKAYGDFNEVITRFPHSYYAEAARQFMIYLRNVIADHELEVGEYYYSRKAYVAAANRANDVVAHYQGAPAVIDALILMIKSYRQLGMKKLELDTIKVLKFNYPNIVVAND